MDLWSLILSIIYISYSCSLQGIAAKIFENQILKLKHKAACFKVRIISFTLI